jgi:hypothetical protein
MTIDEKLSMKIIYNDRESIMNKVASNKDKVFCDYSKQK